MLKVDTMTSRPLIQQRKGRGGWGERGEKEKEREIEREREREKIYTDKKKDRRKET